MTSSPVQVNQAHLRRVCSLLYRRQNCPDSILHPALTKTDFQLTHEFFLQVCSKFPYSWKPIYKFFHFSQKNPNFHHTSVTFNKMLAIFGRARNIDILWDVIQEMGRRRLVNDETFQIALKTLALAKELKRSVEFFHLMNAYGYDYNVKTLNKVVETLCRSKLAMQAKYIAVKLRFWIKLDGLTYKWLIFGFCDEGDLMEASNLWNYMVDDGLELNVDAVDIMIDTLYKCRRYDDAMKFFQWMRLKNIDVLGLSSYRLVVKWMCKIGQIEQARAMFEEMQQRGIQPDSVTLGWWIFGLLHEVRVREAYLLMDGIAKPDINVYHGFIRGFLKLRRTHDATQIFREMISRGCEPIMHTYIMLLQGHLGRRGGKASDSDPLVNFDNIIIGGMVKAGKSHLATKYVERILKPGHHNLPRFDYNKFLYYYSNEQGVAMFEAVATKLREIGSFDLADIFARYGEKMTTRLRRMDRAVET